ncbi:MAG: dUTP diphosphatase [Deltaproteobacteria bacterium]|jgi:dUTP pyrophosphatase|nr:dUTP diphosphatase [Deltaproteobacteria bacterium]
MKTDNIDIKITFLNGAGQLYGLEAEACSGVSFAPATAGSAGFDLRANFAEGEAFSIEPGARLGVPSGIAIEPLRSDVAGFVYSRSGLGAVQGLTVAQGVGVIDPDYRGEIKVFLLNTSGEVRTVRRGDRVAQLVFQPFFRPGFIVADELGETERGGGGFGHTGR